MSTLLRNVREEKGLTQVQVAKSGGVSTRVYQRYETGECIPNVHTAQLIAQVLNTTVDEIFPVASLQN